MTKVAVQLLTPDVLELVVYQESYTIGEIICKELEICSSIARVAYRQDKQNVSEEKRNLLFTVAFKKEEEVAKYKEIIKQCLRDWLSRELIPATKEFQQNMKLLKKG